MLKLIATGNLGQDCKLTETNGRTAIQFSIAQNYKFTDKEGNKVEKTTWLSCTYWRDQAQSKEVAKYLKKGAKILIEGMPEVKTYVNQEGKTVAALNVTVAGIEIIVFPEDPAAAGATQQPAAQPATRTAAPVDAGPDHPIYESEQEPPF